MFEQFGWRVFSWLDMKRHIITRNWWSYYKLTTTIYNGGTFSSMIDHLTMAWTLHLSKRLVLWIDGKAIGWNKHPCYTQYLPCQCCSFVGRAPTIAHGKAPCIHYRVWRGHAKRLGWRAYSSLNMRRHIMTPYNWWPCHGLTTAPGNGHVLPCYWLEETSNTCLVSTIVP